MRIQAGPQALNVGIARLLCRNTAQAGFEEEARILEVAEHVRLHLQQVLGAASDLLNQEVGRGYHDPGALAMGDLDDPGPRKVLKCLAHRRPPYTVGVHQISL
ncbi:hypothetical protein ACINB_06060 [Acidovorax sp. NB1]|nr:hypothetical protein ACINB_06060 [Acidovorax sp. NB1]